MPVIDDIIRLHHIHDAASKAVEFTKTKKRTELETNEMLSFALVRLMEIIGEAATGISEELKRKYPTIAWRPLKGNRGSCDVSDESLPFRFFKVNSAGKGSLRHAL